MLSAIIRHVVRVVFLSSVLLLVGLRSVFPVLRARIFYQVQPMIVRILVTNTLKFGACVGTMYHAEA